MDTGQKTNTGNKGALTPDQLAQLQRHKVASPAPQSAAPPIVQKPPARQQVNNQQQSAPQVVQQEEQQADENANYSPSEVEVTDADGETYYKYQDKDGSSFEADLVTFREKGRETRYLSLALKGFDMNQDPPSPQQSFLSIGSREAFDKMKSFFSQLSWED